MAEIVSLKNLKVGDKFSVTTFTGLNVGQYTVISCTKKEIRSLKADLQEIVFDRETGIQLNAPNPKYANKAVELMPFPTTKKNENRKSRRERRKEALLKKEAETGLEPMFVIEEEEVELEEVEVEDAEEYEEIE